MAHLVLKKKHEREEFYSVDVARLLMHSSDNMVLAGDFVFLRPQTVWAYLMSAEHAQD